jgi:hypothetical protein
LRAHQLVSHTTTDEQGTPTCFVNRMGK